MKHAGSAALDQLDDLLAALRQCSGLKERQRGVFYRSGKAFLHFHEDAVGLFADLRAGGDWMRLPVNLPAEAKIVLAQVKRALKA
jgi:hypothetical protein